MNHQDNNESVSRRKFLKVAGTIVMVTGAGCTLAGAADKSVKTKLPPSDGYILVDTKKCQGCVSCMLACSLVHEGLESQSLSRIQIIQDDVYSGKPLDTVMKLEIAWFNKHLKGKKDVAPSKPSRN